MCSNPEFLKEGAAIDDFMKPDRVVIGVGRDHARSVMAELYAPFVRTGKPIIFMDIPSAEMTKYAANAMLATRISFMNEIANLCERVGADVDQVRKGIGTDGRIGPAFLFPGPGYGGSCFPKDVKALVRTASDVGVPLRVLDAVEEANDAQKHRLFEKVASVLRICAGKRVAVWGLAFKPNTDDMREAPSLVLIEELLAAGATVVAHDPVAMHEAERRIGDRISYAETSYEALEGADALVVVTDWNEYRHPDFARIKSALRTPVVVDGRNLYDARKMRALGFTYSSIGRGEPSGVRVLITGAAGFLGSHLCDRFLADGHNVVGLDNFVTGHPDNIAHLIGNDRFEFIRHDISTFTYVEGRSTACCISRRRRVRSTTSSCRSRRSRSARSARTTRSGWRRRRARASSSRRRPRCTAIRSCIRRRRTTGAT